MFSIIIGYDLDIVDGWAKFQKLVSASSKATELKSEVLQLLRVSYLFTVLLSSSHFYKVWTLIIFGVKLLLGRHHVHEWSLWSVSVPTISTSWWPDQKTTKSIFRGELCNGESRVHLPFGEKLSGSVAPQSRADTPCPLLLLLLAWILKEFSVSALFKS